MAVGGERNPPDPAGMALQGGKGSPGAVSHSRTVSSAPPLASRCPSAESTTLQFRRHFNRQGRLAGFLVPNAYAAYIIHAPVITSLAFAARDVALYPLLKWILVALVAVPLCFGLSSLMRKLPYTERVL